MVTKIKWNKAADKSFDEIIGYLNENYSLQSAKSFATVVYKRIDQIVKGQTIGRFSPKAKTILILRLSKHKQMFYRLKGSTLIIIDFWDTRQDPKKKPY